MRGNADTLQVFEGDLYGMESRRNEVIAHALQDGLTVEYGRDGMFQLDIDSPEQLEKTKGLIVRLQKLLGIERATVTRSRSGNWHVHVYLDESSEAFNAMSRRERVLLQAVLGSDPVRAALDWAWAVVDEDLGGEAECFLITQRAVFEDELPLPQPLSVLEEPTEREVY